MRKGEIGENPIPIELGSALIYVGSELLLLTLAVFRLALALVSQTNCLDVAAAVGVEVEVGMGN